MNPVEAGHKGSGSILRRDIDHDRAHHGLHADHLFERTHRPAFPEFGVVIEERWRFRRSWPHAHPDARHAHHQNARRNTRGFYRKTEPVLRRAARRLQAIARRLHAAAGDCLRDHRGGHGGGVLARAPFRRSCPARGPEPASHDLDRAGRPRPSSAFGTDTWTASSTSCGPKFPRRTTCSRARRVSGGANSGSATGRSFRRRSGNAHRRDRDALARSLSPLTTRGPS